MSQVHPLGPVAVFSPCRRYRYVLWRTIESSLFRDRDKAVMFIGLNPSTADEVRDDPTIRRCIGFSREWGYSRLCMTNLFAYRATDPRVMKEADDPIGPENDDYLRRLSKEVDCVIAAWGNGGGFNNRDTAVMDLFPSLYALGLTRAGKPRHPLYVRSGSEPILWK